MFNKGQSKVYLLSRGETISYPFCLEWAGRTKFWNSSVGKVSNGRNVSAPVKNDKDHNSLKMKTDFFEKGRKKMVDLFLHHIRQKKVFINFHFQPFSVFGASKFLRSFFHNFSLCTGWRVWSRIKLVKYYSRVLLQAQNWSSNWCPYSGWD